MQNWPPGDGKVFVHFEQRSIPGCEDAAWRYGIDRSPVNINHTFLASAFRLVVVNLLLQGIFTVLHPFLPNPVPQNNEGHSCPTAAPSHLSVRVKIRSCIFCPMSSPLSSSSNSSALNASAQQTIPLHTDCTVTALALHYSNFRDSFDSSSSFPPACSTSPQPAPISFEAYMLPLQARCLLVMG